MARGPRKSSPHRGLAPQVRAELVARSLARKVWMIEEAAKADAPIPPWIPRTPSALRAWNNSKLGVTAWSSWSVAAPSGPHPELRARFDDACALMEKRELGAPASPDPVPPSETVDWKQLAHATAEQVNALIAEKVALHRQLEIARATASSIKAELDSLRTSADPDRPRLRDVSRDFEED